jgi:hypothetical protein
MRSASHMLTAPCLSVIVWLQLGTTWLTVVPRNFREVKGFLERVGEGENIECQYKYKVPDSRQKGRTQNYRIHAGERMDAGYRILWIHSEAKERLERKSREQRIAKAEQAVEKLSSGLNRRSLKSREQIERAVNKATQGARAYGSVTIHEEKTTEQVQVGRGRPGVTSRAESTFLN